MFKSPLDKAREDIAASPTGARGAIDMAGIRRAGDRSVARTQELEQQHAANIQTTVRRAQPAPTQATAKVFFNPSTKQYFVGGKAVPARYDVLSYLADAPDLPDQAEAPAGFVPLSQKALKLYVQQIHSEMEGTAPTQFWDALKTGMGDVVTGIPRLLGFDVKNPYADQSKESYAGMSLREQAGAQEGAFDSMTGFTNTLGQGLGSAVPAIAAGTATTAATLNPLAGLAAAGTVGFSQSAGAGSESAQQAIAQTFVEMGEEYRRKASPAYAALRDHGVPEELAIDQVAFDASRYAGAAAGVTTIPETIIGGKFLGNFARRVPGLGGFMERVAGAEVKGAISKIPAPLRFLGRSTAAGIGEGSQEVAETVAGRLTGNLAAGVGSTDPTDFVDRRDFEGGFPVGALFGGLGGGHRAGTNGGALSNSDIGAALGAVENERGPNPTALDAPPPVPQMPGGLQRDMPLEQQAELINSVLSQRYGENWTDHIDHIMAMDDPGNLSPGMSQQGYPAGGRHLIGQLMGILQEIDARDAAQPPGFSQAGQERATAAAEAGMEAPVGAQPDLFGGTRPGMEPMQPMQLPERDAGPAPEQLGMNLPQNTMGMPEGPVGPQGQFASEPQGELPPPNLIERRAFQQQQMADRAAQSEQNPQALPTSGVAELEAQMELLQEQIDARPPKDPVRRRLVAEMKRLEAMWQEAKLAAGPQGVMPYARVDAPDPAEAPAERTPDGRPMGVAPAPLVNPEPMSPQEAASRQQTQAARRRKAGAPAAAPAPAQAVPDALPVPATDPEPAADIEAQVQALLDPASQRDAVFVADGTPAPATPKGIIRVVRKGVGTLLTTNTAKAQEFRSKKLTDKVMARILGYSKGKQEIAADVAKGDTPIAVQARTPDGAVQAEQLTTVGEKLKAKRAVKKQASKTAKVVETTPEKALEDRAARAATETPKAPVKLGPKGEKAKAASIEREQRQKEKRTPKSKRKGKATADDERTTVVDGVAYPEPPRRQRMRADQTNPVPGERLTINPRTQRVVGNPKSLITEVGSDAGPAKLLTQAIDEPLRAQLQGLLQLGLDKDSRARVMEILRGFTRIEMVLQADAEAAEAALVKQYEADPVAAEKFKAELEAAKAAKPEAGTGRPRLSLLYTLPLLETEMRQFMDTLVAQAKWELATPGQNQNQSVAMRMLSELIPGARIDKASLQSEAQIRTVLRTLAELDGKGKAALLDAGRENLRDQTLAKQVVRGASEVAYAMQGEDATGVKAPRVQDTAVEALEAKQLPYVTVVGEVPAAAGKLINGWVQLFEKVAGMASPKDFRVMSIAAARRLPGAPSRLQTINVGAYFRQVIDGKPVYVLAVNWNALPEPAAIEALAHEFGHFISDRIVDKADSRTIDALRAAYRNWKQATGHLTPEDVMLSRMPPALAAELKGMLDPTPEYAASFHEWMADNVARWMLTSAKPRTLVEKFFAKVAEVLRKIYDSALGKLPDRTVAQILDVWTAQSRAAATIAEELERDPGAELMATTEELEVSAAERLAAVRNRREGVQALEAAGTMGDMVKAVYGKVRTTAKPENFMRTMGGDKFREGGLQLLTTHQIADMYADSPIGPALRRLVQIRDRIDAQAKKIQQKGADAVSKAQNLSAANQDLLQQVMYFATYYNLNPEVGIDHESNQHVLANTDPQVQAEQARRYAKTRALYEQLTKSDPRAEGIYEELRDAFEEIRVSTIEQKVANLRRSGMSEGAIATLEKKLEDLKAQRREGPYFPLMRVGKWIVKAVLPSEAFGEGGPIVDGGKEFATKTAATQEANNLRAMYPGAKVTIEAGSEGGHVVRVFRHGIYFFNSEAEAIAARPEIEAEIRDEYRARNGNYDETSAMLQGLDESQRTEIISAPYKKLDFYEESKEAPNDEFLRELRQLMKEEQVSEQFGRAVEEMYLEALPEYSYRKSQLRRDNILGASKDMLYAYAHRIGGAAHNLATITDARALNESWADLIAQRTKYAPAADVANTIKKNDMLVHERTQPTAGNRVLNFVSDANSAFSLALSPMYVITNSMQVGMVTTPYLAAMTDAKGESIGWARSIKYIKEAYAGTVPYFTRRAMKEFVAEARRVAGKASDDGSVTGHVKEMIDKFGKTDGEKAMLHELFDRGRLDFAFLNSLQDAMRSGKWGQKFGALLRLGMAFPQQVEAMNRVVTALAAYRMAVKEMGMPEAMATEVDGRTLALGESVDFADTVVRKTQLDYSRRNRPVLFNRPIAGMVLQFRLFMQGMYMLFVENAVRALRGATPEERKQGRRMIINLLATHAAVGGATGIAPVYWMAKVAAYPVLLGLRAIDDDDDKYTWHSIDEMVRQQTTEWFGKTGSRALMNGLPTLLGVDVSERVGLPTLADTKYMGMSDRDKPADTFDKTFLYMLGSPYSNARRVFAGTANLMDGDLKEASKGLPSGVRAAARAYTFAKEGIVDSDGDTFVPRSAFNPAEIAAKALGIDTVEVSEAYRQRSTEYAVKGRIQMERERLMKAYRTADPEARKALRDEIRDFNSKAPRPFRILPEQLRKSLEAKAERDAGKVNDQDRAVKGLLQ